MPLLGDGFILPLPRPRIGRFGWLSIHNSMLPFHWWKRNRSCQLSVFAAFSTFSKMRSKCSQTLSLDVLNPSFWSKPDLEQIDNQKNRQNLRTRGKSRKTRRLYPLLRPPDPPRNPLGRIQILQNQTKQNNRGKINLTTKPQRHQVKKCHPDRNENGCLLMGNKRVEQPP